MSLNQFWLTNPTNGQKIYFKALKSVLSEYLCLTFESKDCGISYRIRSSVWTPGVFVFKDEYLRLLDWDAELPFNHPLPGLYPDGLDLHSCMNRRTTFKQSWSSTCTCTFTFTSDRCSRKSWKTKDINCFRLFHILDNTFVICFDFWKVFFGISCFFRFFPLLKVIKNFFFWRNSKYFNLYLQ